MTTSFVRRNALLALAVCASLTVHANLVTNITAYCRANNAATAKLVRGEHYTSQYHVEHAFDGDVTTNEGRMLLNSGVAPTPENPDIVGYDISDDFLPGARFVVNGFRFYRALNQEELKRSITMIHLEASDNGVDGWTRLGGTDSPMTIYWEQKRYTVTIPIASRRPSRHYRFVITGNNGETQWATVSTSELELLGEVMEPEVLTWNGESGGTWDSTAVSWQNPDGQPVAWSDRAVAALGEKSVVLSGTARAGEVRLGVNQTLSGGTLDFLRPGVLSVRDGAVVASAIGAGLVVTDTVASAAVGTRVYDGFPEQSPTDPTHSVPTVFWRGREVSEIVDFVSAGSGCKTYAKQQVGALYEALPMHVRPSDSGMEFQLHCVPQSGLVLGEGFNLSQTGDEVIGEAIFSKYVWNGNLLYWDFAVATNSLCAGSVLDVAHNNVSLHYGAKTPYLAVSALTSALTVKGASGEQVYPADDYLPGDAETHKTGVAVRFLRNAVLSGITGFAGAQIRIYSNWHAAKPYRVVRTDDRLTVQFKCPYNGGATLCVKVEFTQNGPDVDARIVYAKYHYNLPEDYDCDIPATGLYENTIWDANHAEGYGLKDIRLLGYRESVRFDGAFAGNRNVTVADVRMTLGASSLDLGQVFSGNGLLAFSPASGTQAVAFNGVCECGHGLELAGATTVTVGGADAFAAELPLALKDGATLAVPAGTALSAGAATFSGTSTITLAAGASLSLDSVTMADDAVVNLVVADGMVATAVRVGTSATVARSVLNHFRLNGKKINRQTEAGWLNPEDPGVMMILR